MITARELGARLMTYGDRPVQVGLFTDFGNMTVPEGQLQVQIWVGETAPVVTIAVIPEEAP